MIYIINVLTQNKSFPMESPSSLARLTISTIAALSISVFAVQAYAKTSAHEHGAARLTIASGEEGIEISFESPAANVFGFEHMPSSENDHAIIDKAVDLLKKGDLLFAMNESADCKFESVEVESSMIEENDDHDKHEEEGHDKHKDDDHKNHKEDDHDKHEKDDHDGHKRDSHDKHDDHNEEHSTTHNDVDVMWQFSCKDHEAIEQVEVKLISAFPKGIEELDVDWITPSKSGHVELEKDGVVALK